MAITTKYLGAMGNRDRAAITPADLTPARNVEVEVPLTRAGGGEAVLMVGGTSERVSFSWSPSGWKSDWDLRLEVGGLSIPYHSTVGSSTPETVTFVPPGPGRVRLFITRPGVSARTFYANGFLIAILGA